MARSLGEAYKVVEATRPQGDYRGAVVGCGRMGSTIDDEHIHMAHYPWPWAHAPAMIEARGIKLAAAADVDRAKLDDFGQRWGVEALYEDFRELVQKEKPDVVAVTTRPEERAEVVVGLAEAGVRAIYATKPMCRTLAQADAMIEACARTGTILAIACHLNWYNYYAMARQAIADGAIGDLRSMVCHCPHSLSNIHSHSLALMRLFAGAPVEWVMGEMDSDEQAQGDGDISGSGYVAYANGVRGFVNSRADRSGHGWTMEFIGERGMVVTRNAHAQFELWGAHPETGEPIQRQFPNPWHPRSSMVDAFEGVCRSIEAGEEKICPGEFGREALETVIALRESHRRGNVRVELPLEDRELRMGAG